MGGALDESVTAVTGLVRDILGDVFGALDSLRSATEALIHARRAQDAAVLRRDLAVLRPPIEALLGAFDGLVAGAGYIPAPGTLADEQRWLEWWMRGERSRAVRRLVVDLDPGSDHYLDFTRLPWYETPMRTGRPHITGPYVDYFCTDEYSLTLTVPVGPAPTAGPQRVGVVGADVFVSDLEPRLLPSLADLPVPAALVNSQGRVVMSTSQRHATGSLVRHPALPAPGAPARHRAAGVGGPLHQCGDWPLFLLTAAP